ncbi:MAG: transcription elongation factor GreA [Eubacteriales bacterium]
MAKDAIILTAKGVKELENKLDFLKTTRRSEIAEQIKVAREFGDLSENAEYDEAKNEQARVEAEIGNIEKMLRNAVVVDEGKVDVRKVGVGTVVRVYDKTYKEEIEYQIVGSAEVDLKKNKISNESPVGSALIGKKVGEVVDIEAPGGKLVMEIKDIHR